jgi:hypothetical protein
VIGVLAQAEVRHDDQVVTGLRPDVGDRDLGDPVRVVRGAAALVLGCGDVNTMMPPTTAPAASAAAFRRLSLVCCTTPGIEPIGTGSVMPSLMNTGRTSSAGRSAVSATMARSARVPRSRRGRSSGNPAVMTLSYQAEAPA